MNFKRLLLSAFVAVSLICSVPLMAQTINQNFSNIRVDELSDSQIQQFLAQLQASGLSEAQAVQVATARGMSPSEVQKLQARILQLKKATSPAIRQTDGASRGLNFSQPASDTSAIGFPIDSTSLAEKALLELRSKIFGANLFQNAKITFEPNLRLATPANYQIGPDDQLLIDIYGYSQASYQLTVSPEGTINIPNVGMISVSGMTIEQASSRIRSKLASIYSDLRTGNTSVSIAIGNIRSIKVILTGEVTRPGTYTLPSLATVFNALYSAGGPTENGSFRKVEIIRAGRKIGTLDIYDFLVQGSLKNNVRLQDQDVIRIPPYISRVEVVGEVKRPAIFEIVPGETLDNLLSYAGGFTERAYRERIKVLKNTATERRIADVTSGDFDAYAPASGDKFFVDEILDRFENRVTIDGAVFRPGEYELEAGLTVGQLIRKAEGVREDAFINRAYITRLKNDMQPELISFDVAKVLSGQSADIPLKREDVINISSIFDLKEEYRISVDGEVRIPGSFKYAEGMSLEDAILQAGGFTETATPQRIEISRRVQNSDALSASAPTAEVFQVNVGRDLKSATSGFVLKPFDMVVVRPAAGYEIQRQVRVEGEVLYPGIYSITKKDERLSDLIKRAGGFTALAHSEGASLKRSRQVPKDSVVVDMPFEGQLTSKKVEQLKSQGAIVDTVQVMKEVEEFVGIDLPRILKGSGGSEDLFLEEGDILTIPKQLQTVRIKGQVLSPVSASFLPGRGFKYYISSAGGFTANAAKKRAYIVYANGSAKSTKKILFFNNYPEVKPGSEIIVPQGPTKRPFNISQWVGVTSSIVTLMLLISRSL